jgi:hypothetical protein
MIESALSLGALAFFAVVLGALVPMAGEFIQRGVRNTAGVPVPGTRNVRRDVA